MKKTLAEIIERKKQGELDKFKTAVYYSETLETDIQINKIPLSEYLEITENIGEDSLKGMNELLFKCCPIFRESPKEAMEAYGVCEAVDLPSAILEEQINEMKEIIEKINGFYGINKLKDDDIKN